MNAIANATAATHLSEAAQNRAIRGGFVRDTLKAERWSARAASLAIGVSHSALSSRFNGETAFLAEELEVLASLLKRDPVEFYAAYLAAPFNEKDPAAEATGPEELPELDSNQQPAG